jgi:hypothetical protein
MVAVCSLQFEIWVLFWNLEFGAWNFLVSPYLEKF